MIQIKRVDEPQILQEKGIDWSIELCSQLSEYNQLLQEYRNGIHNQNPKKPSAKSERYAHKEIRESLEQMSHQKCCYCESPVIGITFAHIEHLYPKSKFPELSYKWDNLYYCCPVCNVNKGNQLPTTPLIEEPYNCNDKGHVIHHIIDPVADDPSKHFRFHNEHIIPTTVVAKKLCEICKLDRDDLNKLRRIALRPVKKLVELFYKSDTTKAMKDEIAAELRTYLLPDTPYSAMFRSFFMDREILPLLEETTPTENPS